MFEFDVAIQAKVPMAHSHDGYEETIYGLDGVLTFTMEGKRIEVGPGDVLWHRNHGIERKALVRRGIAPHQVRSRHQRPEHQHTVH